MRDVLATEAEKSQTAFQSQEERLGLCNTERKEGGGLRERGTAARGAWGNGRKSKTSFNMSITQHNPAGGIYAFVQLLSNVTSFIYAKAQGVYMAHLVRNSGKNKKELQIHRKVFLS